MSGTATPNVHRVNGPLSTKRSRSCDEIYGSVTLGRCCCNCVGCACKTNTEQNSQAGAQPIPCFTPMVVNAYGPLQINSVSSGESFASPASVPYSDSMPKDHFVGAPSLQLLNRVQPPRSEKQMRQDAKERFLDDFDDPRPRMFQEPDEMDDTMPGTPYPMDLDDFEGSGQADRRSSISMLSEYAQSFVMSNLSASGLLVGAGAVTVANSDGNRYLELTERLRHPPSN